MTGCANQRNSISGDCHVSACNSLKLTELEEASVNFQKALKGAPCSSPEFYFDGIKVYKKLISYYTKIKQKEAYQDTVMSLYNGLLTCFKYDSIRILNSKAYDSYILFVHDKDKIEGIYLLYQATYKMSGIKFYNINILPYLDIARRYYFLSGSITEKNLYNLSEELITHIDIKIAEGDDSEKLRFVKEKLYELLPPGNPIDCDFIIDVLLLKLDPKYLNEKLADNIVRLSMNCDDCKRDQLLKIIDRLEFCGDKIQAAKLKVYLMGAQ